MPEMLPPSGVKVDLKNAHVIGAEEDNQPKRDTVPWHVCFFWEVSFPNSTTAALGRGRPFSKNAHTKVALSE